MPITAQQLLQILPNAGPVAGVFVPVLNTAMNRYQIVGPKRIAAFIAQIGHESGQLKYVKEIWGPTAAQAKYEGRKDLGNTVVGDGSKYRGRGLIQITGRANYMACGEGLGLEWRGKPQAIRSDNGPEFISAKLTGWAEKQGIRLEYIQPGNPQQNAYVERYNRTVRYDWLGHYLFESIAEVQDYGTNWIWTYNHERPNMALGGITPKQKLALVA